MMYEIELIRSKRRTLSIEIKNDGRVLVRAPLNMPTADIQRLVREKSSWIETHRERVKKEQSKREAPFTEEEIRRLADAAAKDIPQRVSQYAPLVGVTVGKITIRNQKTRWGSCSSKGNLNFNCLLMLCPEDVRDYVVVHELCHRREMNHSSRFWAEVERILPDYKTQKQWLKENGTNLIRRSR